MLSTANAGDLHWAMVQLFLSLRVEPVDRMLRKPMRAPIASSASAATKKPKLNRDPVLGSSSGKRTRKSLSVGVVVLGVNTAWNSGGLVVVVAATVVGADVVVVAGNVVVTTFALNVVVVAGIVVVVVGAAVVVGAGAVVVVDDGGGMTAVTVAVRRGEVAPPPEAVALFVTDLASTSATRIEYPAAHDTLAPTARVVFADPHENGVPPLMWSSMMVNCVGPSGTSPSLVMT